MDVKFNGVCYDSRLEMTYPITSSMFHVDIELF